MRPTVLYICHNHPAVRPGGAEAYALELHHYMRRSDTFDSVFLAKGGPPLSPIGRPHMGTYVSLVDDSPDEYFLHTDDYQYDWIFGTMRDNKDLYTKHLRGFLEGIRPDIVHLHHTMFFGYDVLREIRNTLPDSPIVYTLHEFMPICHRQGQMVRTMDDEFCTHASPRRCHECYPEISPQAFFMRKRFIQSHFALVDLFIAPSEFLRDRYVAWGIPPDRIVVEEYGRTPPPGTAVDDERLVRDRFGYFGQLTPFKGLRVVLEAMHLLLGAPAEQDPLLRALDSISGEGARAEPAVAGARALIHGANLDLQPGTFQNRVKELLEQTKENVTFVGRYDHTRLAGLMSNVDWVIVPSIWWENSPLVIQEAFHFGRPVICSDIGGMAEKVAHGVNGLHFRAGDAADLARTLEMAVTTPGLWQTLRDGISPVYPMEDHAVALRSLYESLAERGEVAHVG
jgi:glycosyltransferase involved in cell wall biosynthesis